MNEIPGWMAPKDLDVIAELSRSVPYDGLIVEVGSWMGQSTEAWALNTKARIIAIDLWEWMPKEYSGPGEASVNLAGDPYGQFRNYTKHMLNIFPLRRESSGGEWLYGNADIVFIDAMHRNPWIGQDIRFWEEKVKPGGIICGDDYSDMFPDVKSESAACAKRLGTDLETPGTKFWIVRKPY